MRRDPAIRHPLNFEVRMKPSDARSEADALLIAQSVDMSESGLGLTMEDAETYIKVGETFELTIPLDGPRALRKSVKMKAIIIWAKGDRFGVEIVGARIPQRVMYDSLIHGFEALHYFNPAAVI